MKSQDLGYGLVFIVLGVITILLWALCPQPNAVTWVQKNWMGFFGFYMVAMGVATARNGLDADWGGIVFILWPAVPFVWAIEWVEKKGLGVAVLYLFLAIAAFVLGFFTTNINIYVGLYIVNIGVSMTGCSAAHFTFRKDWRKAEEVSIPFLYVAAWFAAPIMIIAWSHQTPVSLPSSVEEGMRKGILM